MTLMRMARSIQKHLYKEGGDKLAIWSETQASFMEAQPEEVLCG